MRYLIPTLLVKFYSFWHGVLHLKGAGYLLNRGAERFEGLHDYPLRLPEGPVVRVDFRELSGIGWLNNILGDSEQEDSMIDAICKYLRSDSIFWDVGSNAGVVSYLIINRTPVRELHFFEPNPKLYQWSSSALSLKANATGHQVALSDAAGQALLHIPRNRSACGSLNGSNGSDTDQVSVAKKTGDDLVYVDGLKPPSVIKIDTEGHEGEVLTGMKRLIEEHRPTIIFEHIELSDAQIEQMIPTGYELKSISDKDASLTPGFDRSASHNSILIPR